METLTRSKEDWQVTKGSVKERFKELLTLSQWTDCAFAIGDEEEVVRCHKLVLAVSSPVFEALFFGGFGNPNEVIRVPDMEPYIFKLLLKYMYSDSLELEGIDEASGMLYAAKKYLMPQLSRLCLNYLVENICIKNLWDILPIAESLDEHELLIPCLKVMCKYPEEVWWGEEKKGERRPNKRTMELLVQQKWMNMSEEELWKVVLRWARGEEAALGLQLSTIMAPLLSSFRFLLFTPDGLTRNVSPSQVLSPTDMDSLNQAVSSSNPSLLPPGFSKCSEKRSKLSQVTWRCSREVLGRERVWLYGGVTGCKLTSSNAVLLTGFEVFTRVSSSDIVPHCGIRYRERLALFLKDPQGNLLAKIDHDCTVEFNSLQVIMLVRPVWLVPNVPYEVIFELPLAEYPLVSFWDTAFAKSTTFMFDDTRNITHQSNVSFINAVLYTL